MQNLFLIFFFFIFSTNLFGQNTATVSGIVLDENKKPLAAVSIGISGTQYATVSNEDGSYSLKVPADIEIQLVFNLLGKKPIVVTLNLKSGEQKTINKNMMPASTDIGVVNIIDKKDRNQQIMRIDYKKLDEIPNPSLNFEGILKTLGPVVSNNELSSEYSVRGGNYDENLVYVNDVEIYRPQLVRSGFQEGLTFINSDMVSGIKFSAGGFDAAYGDKMSSALDIRYRKPTKFGVKGSLSLLGGSLMIEGASINKKLNYLVGARNKTTTYLLGTLDTKGEYKPSFYDVQANVNYDISKKSTISFLGNLSSSKYNVVPENRSTDFGTVSQALRLTVYFEGQEVDAFTTSTSALTFAHNPNDKLRLKFIASSFQTLEDETFDILGQYFLDELEKDPAADGFGEVKFNLGVGSFLNHARNELRGEIYSGEHKGIFDYSKNSQLQWGIRYSHESFRDEISEWNYIDSAGYSLPHPPDTPGDSTQDPRPLLLLQDVIYQKNNIESSRYSGFVQNTFTFNDSSRSSLTIGTRFSYWDLNEQFIITPRVAYSYQPKWKRNFNFRFATGMYYQPPLYKELKNIKGEINTDVKAQQSIHFVAGTDYYFLAWGREFKFVTEAYYKSLSKLVPYKVDNIRIRYFGDNISKGYATGIDFRINGQFVPDAESWASLSFLKTEEDIANDLYYIYYNTDGEKIYPYTVNQTVADTQKVIPGYLPRLTDQRATFSIFFSDYLPKFPSYKMHMTLVFGTGLPTGPPGNDRYKDTYRFPFYRRVDIGFTKQFIDEDSPKKSRIKFFNHFKSLSFSLDVFNLFQVNNTVSYIWVSDVYGTKYGVPNYLTGRQINARLNFKF